MKPLRPPPSFFLRPPSGGLASAALPPPSDLQSGGRGLRFLSLSQSSSRSSLRLSHPLSSFLLSAPPGEVVWEETDSMGFLSTLLGVVGFGAGLPLGLVLGYFIFIYSEPSDVQDPITRKIHDLDSKTLKQLLPEIPLWVKRPDYERGLDNYEPMGELFGRKQLFWKPFRGVETKYEVDWMNKFIAELWPWFDKAACDMIRSMAKPIFDQYIGKFHIKSIEFGLLTLGTLPPTLYGVNFYETNERELILETDIRWGGNPNVIVAVNFPGFRITAQLIDPQIFMSLRVTLKPLVPTFPCFASVGMSLMDKPHVDFGLKLAGADVMAIPIVYRFAQEAIKEQIGDLCLWPQALEVAVLDGFSAMRKPVGILHVKVLRALDLLKMDFLGKSDPYVELSLSGERLPAKRTTVKMCELNPEWNERFKLVVKDPETQVLELHVFDWEKMKAHDKLGMQVVPLSLLSPNETRRFTLDLVKNLNPNDPHNRRSRGRITVELRLALFREEVDPCPGGPPDGEGEGRSGGAPSPVSARSPGDGVLSVAVVRAGGVEGKHHTNTYAVVAFKGEQRKTKVVNRSREPRWDEEFQFMLEGPPVDEKIHIEVMSKRRGFSLHSKESLGHVDVNLVDVVNSGRINETYNLINSRRGVIHVDIKWRTA